MVFGQHQTEDFDVSDNLFYSTFTGKQSKSYIASDQTAEIVNLAIRLGRPLLVEGEAGCGKTSLARAIAEELSLDKNFISITVKSTSQAKDLLYRFDALRRLQESQNPNSNIAHRVYPFIQLEPLGYAIQAGKPSVVLIDEIDKADIDFPNDLLDVLDRFEFDIEDLPREESDECKEKRGFARHVASPQNGIRPIVIITSNREKQLPEPFLRRCLYIQLNFPEDESMLFDIVKSNLCKTMDQISENLINDAVTKFCEIRRRGSELNLQKLPATSELVDWVRVLHWKGRSPKDTKAGQLNSIDHAVLFKIRQDIEHYQAHTKEETAG